MNNQLENSNPLNSYLFGYCKYTGTSDMYPKKYRNLINSEHSKEAAIKIQRWWKSCVTKRKSETISNDRFPSWFSF